RPERLNGHRRVQIGRQADIHRVDLRIGQYAFDIAKLLNARKIEFLSRPSEIALNRREISGQRAFVRGAYGGQLPAAHVSERLQWGAPHEPESDNGNTHNNLRIQNPGS